MKQVLIVIQVEQGEKENILKSIMYLLDLGGSSYLYEKTTNSIILVNQYGFATFEYNGSYYKDPNSGKEYGEMEVTITSTASQLPQMTQEVIGLLKSMGLHDDVVMFHINMEVPP
jgi:hypothetical protein